MPDTAAPDISTEAAVAIPSAPAVSEDPAAQQTPQRDFEQAVYPYRTRIRRADYERRKVALQVELLKAQAWVQETGQKVVMLFEGRDAAGKGGTIKRFMEHLNPRAAPRSWR